MPNIDIKKKLPIPREELLDLLRREGYRIPANNEDIVLSGNDEVGLIVNWTASEPAKG